MVLAKGKHKQLFSFIWWIFFSK